MIRNKPAKPWKRSWWHCRKCGVHTGDNQEYYMVQDELWQWVIERWKIPADEYGEIGRCIGCLEQLLGRKLTRQDFTDCEVNRLDCWWNIKSPAMRAVAVMIDTHRGRHLGCHLRGQSGLANAARCRAPTPAILPQFFNEIVTLMLLWEEYCDTTSNGFSYSWFCEQVSKLAP
jgi:hypothetical protein